MFFLFNRQYGALEMVGNQWVGPKGVKFGQFRSKVNGIYVNLPISEVIILPKY